MVQVMEEQNTTLCKLGLALRNSDARTKVGASRFSPHVTLGRTRALSHPARGGASPSVTGCNRRPPLLAGR